MHKRTCKACGSTFEAKSRNANYCSEACRPTHAQRKAAKEKAWKEEQKAQKEREQEFLRRELPNWQGREVRNHMTGQIVEGKALERYLVEWIW